MLENNVCNVTDIVLSFMSIIISCCLIMCYLFISEIITYMDGVYYELFDLFSSFFPICISHHVYYVCMYISLKIKFDLMTHLLTELPTLDTKINT